MAFRKTLAHRLFGVSRMAITNCRVSSPCTAAHSKALNHRGARNKLAPDPGDCGMGRRYIHRHSAMSPELRFLPTGEKLLQKVRDMDIARGRIRLDGLRPATAEKGDTEEPVVDGKLTVKDALKILRLSQLEMVKSRLRQVEKDCVSYSEFMEICAKTCSDVDQGAECAKMLDLSGSVIVFGNTVFLKPEKVVKALQGLIPVPHPHIPDLRMKEFQAMKTEKAAIDTRARQLVQRELWCGLGYLIVQTAAFMRLTFWELSWDVMEPICFYVTSAYFMAGYTFFIRTSKEPSFEGFFQSRFSTKQRLLMKARNFDVEKYNELKRACCPDQESDASFDSPLVQ